MLRRMMMAGAPGGGGGGGSDPDWASVVLSLPLTADFVDVRGKAVTVNGPVISGGAAVFDGSNDRLSLASDAGFGFGSGNYTVEGYFRRASGASGNRCIIDTRTGSNTGMAIYASTSTYAGLSFADNAGTLAGHTAQFSISVFEHWAVVRQGTTVRGYVGGVQRFTVADSRAYASASTCFVGDNYLAPSQPTHGEMQAVRITKGVARYPDGTTFTPPSIPYPTS